MTDQKGEFSTRGLGTGPASLEVDSTCRSPRINTRSDRASPRFGVGLPEEELAWLHAAIARIVSVWIVPWSPQGRRIWQCGQLLG